MADRIIKGDSGNDVVIQNNAGSRKIEVTNSGDVEVTGDVKTTTVKATNLKANDGTAGLVVADSTGEVTSSGGLKSVNVKSTNLKANDGTAGLSIADSTGRVTFTEANPIITLGSNATFPAGHVIYANSFSFTSTGAGADPGTSWTNTNLTITVPAASRAKLSKIFINVFNTMYITKGTAGQTASTRILRTVNSVDHEICRTNLIGAVDANYPIIITPNASISGMDTSLGSSSHDHVYTVQYRSDHTDYSGNIYYHGIGGNTDLPIVNISVVGIV